MCQLSYYPIDLLLYVERYLGYQSITIHMLCSLLLCHSRNVHSSIFKSLEKWSLTCEVYLVIVSHCRAGTKKCPSWRSSLSLSNVPRGYFLLDNVSSLRTSAQFPLFSARKNLRNQSFTVCVSLTCHTRDGNYMSCEGTCWVRTSVHWVWKNCSNWRDNSSLHCHRPGKER